MNQRSVWSVACHNCIHCIVVTFVPRKSVQSMTAAMNKIRNAKYQIGQVVRHRLFSVPRRRLRYRSDLQQYRGMVRVDPQEIRPHKDQPFYHLFAENEETEYVAYVSEQNLLPDDSGEPVRHPQVAEVFVRDGDGGYRPRSAMRH